MSKYGQIREPGQTPAEFRVNIFLGDLDVQRGNGGFSKDMIEYLKKNRANIEDAFLDSDSAYILPATRTFAEELYKECVEIDYDYDEEHGIADDISWQKLGDRYWLSLWWD